MTHTYRAGEPYLEPGTSFITYPITEISIYKGCAYRHEEKIIVYGDESLQKEMIKFLNSKFKEKGRI